MTSYYPAQIEQGVTSGSAPIITEPTQDDIVLNGQGAAIVAATVTMDAGGAGDAWPTFSGFTANADTGTGWSDTGDVGTSWAEV